MRMLEQIAQRQYIINISGVVEKLNQKVNTNGLVKIMWH